MPDNAHAYYARACAYREIAVNGNSEKMYLRAIADFKKANQLDGDYEVPRHSIAELRHAGGITDFGFADELKKVAAVALPVLGVIAGAAFIATARGFGKALDNTRRNGLRLVDDVDQAAFEKSHEGHECIGNDFGDQLLNTPATVGKFCEFSLDSLRREEIRVHRRSLPCSRIKATCGSERRRHYWVSRRTRFATGDRRRRFRSTATR